MAGRELDRYEQGRRGTWIVWTHASSWREEWWPIIEEALANPGETLRASRHAHTSRLFLARGDATRPAFLKVYRRSGWRTDLKDLWRPSRAVRALRISRRLAKDGFLAPLAIAAGEERKGRFLRRAFLLTEAVAWPTLAGLGEHVASVAAEERRRRQHCVIDALGSEVGRFHRAGYVHGDLVAPNILVDEGPPVRFCFLDHDRSRRRPLAPGRMQRRDLVELNRLPVPGVRHVDRFRFFRRYADVRGWSRGERRQHARWIAEKTRGLILARARSLGSE